jgi:hypothetical protein
LKPNRAATIDVRQITIGIVVYIYVSSGGAFERSVEVEVSMRKVFIPFAVAAGIGLLTVSSMVSAQDKFDPKAFFDQLQKQGAQLPPGFSPEKFFDDLQKQGAQAGSFDPKRFFEDLQKQGAKLPAAFDPQKFFNDLQQQGGKVPPIIKMK